MLLALSFTLLIFILALFYQQRLIYKKDRDSALLVQDGLHLRSRIDGLTKDNLELSEAVTSSGKSLAEAISARAAVETGFAREEQARKGAAEANAALIERLGDLEGRFDRRGEELAVTREELARLKQKQVEQESFANTVQKVQKAEFESISNSLLKEQRSELVKSVEQLVRPVQDQMQKYSATAESAMTRFRSMQDTLVEQMHLFTKSYKLVGSWGEQQLESLLIAHGMCEGIDYRTQVKSEDGAISDYVVECANIKVIIDVKTPLEVYIRYANAKEEEKEQHLKSLIRAIEGHASDLSDKSYQDKQENSVGFVVMYLPIEAMLMVALQYKPDLYAWCLSKRVLLASTSMIFVLLHSLSHFKQKELYSQNAKRIAEEAGALVDQFDMVVRRMELVERHINSAREGCHDVAKRIESGKGNIMRRIDNIKRYGAKIKSKTNVDEMRNILGKIHGDGVDSHDEEDTCNDKVVDDDNCSSQTEWS